MAAHKRLSTSHSWIVGDTLAPPNSFNIAFAADGRMPPDALDVGAALNSILEKALHWLDVDAAAILVADPRSPVLRCVVHRGFRTDAISRTVLRLREGWLGRAILEGQLQIVSDTTLCDEDMDLPIVVTLEGFRGYAAAPFVVGGVVSGVLELYRRNSLQPDGGWHRTVDTLTRSHAPVIERAVLAYAIRRAEADLEAAQEAMLEMWPRALSLRDRYTEGHSQRVADLTVQMAHALGVGDEEVVHMRRGALLHDIGKLIIPGAILQKAGPLSEDEWMLMRQHPVSAVELLAPVAFLRPALNIPYCHHERWDGAGYPRGLREQQIPFAARLFAVIDVWDALSSTRPYREAWADDRIRAFIAAGAGSQFDPEIVSMILDIGLTKH